MPPSNPEPLDEKPGKEDLKIWEQMIASGSGGVLTSLFMTPFDVVKIRLQAQTKAFTSQKCFLYCNGITEHLCACGLDHKPNNLPKMRRKKFSTQAGHVRLIPPEWFQRPGKFNGTLDAFVKITRNEGLKSLWSGLPPTLVISIPNVMIYFTTYEFLKSRFFKLHQGVVNLVARFDVPIPNARAWHESHDAEWVSSVTQAQGRSFISAEAVGADKEHMPFWVPLAAGALARTFAVSFTNPIELVRTKLQSERLSYKEIAKAVKILVQYKGIGGLWMGLPPTLMRDVPFSAIYWTSLEGLKTAFGETDPNPSFSFFAGAVSGGLAAVATLPFDIVKTHRQIALGESEIYTSTPKQSKQMLTILKELYRAKGISALFTGLTPRLLKVMPACAIMISSYEAMKIVFHRRQSHATA